MYAIRSYYEIGEHQEQPVLLALVRRHEQVRAQPSDRPVRRRFQLGIALKPVIRRDRHVHRREAQRQVERVIGIVITSYSIHYTKLYDLL